VATYIFYLFKILFMLIIQIAGCQWLMPVLIATWEAETGRTVV
jgi:hypothetical protein